VNRFGKIILALVFLAAVAVANLHAQTSATVAAPAADALTATTNAAATVEAPLVTGDAPTLFYLFGCKSIPISNSMIYAWIVVIVVCVLVQISTHKMKDVPTGAQNLLEAMIEGWEGLCNVILEPKVSRWVFPVAVTFFFFALTSNLLGLLPGVGSIGYGLADKTGSFSSLPLAIEHAERPLLRPPTADANMTVVMALIFLVMSFVWALKYNGPMGLIKHVFGVKVDSNKWLYPLLFLMFLFVGLMETLSIVFVRPLALAVRLYGNIFAGESLLAMMMNTKPFILGLLISLPFYFFELFVAVVQAFVFAMLTLAFVGTLCTHADEEHGH
jgi:F-type H+-transporting ATPase subunit a